MRALSKAIDDDVGFAFRFRDSDLVVDGSTVFHPSRYGAANFSTDTTAGVRCKPTARSVCMCVCATQWGTAASPLCRTRPSTQMPESLSCGDRGCR